MRNINTQKRKRARKLEKKNLYEYFSIEITYIKFDILEALNNAVINKSIYRHGVVMIFFPHENIILQEFLSLLFKILTK